MQWHNPIVKDKFFLAIAKFLDTSSYAHLEFNDLFESVTVIQNCYHKMLIANGRELNRLKSKYRIVYNHVIKFLKKLSPQKMFLVLKTYFTLQSFVLLFHCQMLKVKEFSRIYGINYLKSA